VDAFATRAELKVRYSELLTPLLRRPQQRAEMIAEAKRIGAEQQSLAAQGERMIPSATVLARLREAVAPRPRDEAREMPIMLAGDRIGRVRAGKSGGLAVDLQIADDADLDGLLAGLRTALLAARS
jgi:ParB family transcriptional regulator, chromosome partitioning protein